VRRKAGAVLPLEVAILAAAVEMAKQGTVEFHGFLLAKHLRDREGDRSLTAHGTLYKALGRMEKAGLLASVWEDPDRAVAEGRPRRRLYSITTDGRVALAREQGVTAASRRLDPGWNAT
jgi:DNA-binding PadR family transcriptional regulator